MIDWDIIKAEYLTTDTSYRKLSKKYDVSFSQLSARAKAENWIKQKNNKASQIGTAAINASDEAKISEIKDLIGLNKRLIRLVEKTIKVFEDGENEPDVKSIKGLTDTISSLTANVRNLKGLPTQSEREAQEIAKERLAIEKSKADIDNTSKEIVIKYEGNIDEFEEYGN